ncbi:MAG: NTP transferase domain-containing protein [Candidatus Lokiarchaeota archaeon]|nr:NTP transferase domain-containing protein [Candidatus Lokiarchaeota archaeon]
MKTAIVLAAGKGSRMKLANRNKIPKSLLAVADIPILERLINSLLENDIKKIYIIVGHLKEKIISFIYDKFPSICETIISKNYLKGPIYSFNDLLDEINLPIEFLLCPADLIIDPMGIKKMFTYYELKDTDLLVPIDKNANLKGLTIKIEENKIFGTIKKYNFTNNKSKNDAKIIPIVICSKKIEPYVELAMNSGLKRFVDAMNLFLENNNSSHYIDLTPHFWFDVDNREILEKARTYCNKHLSS